ncbi:MAG TPA: PH domain-containing protein [Acidimicrobiales bacterium]|nr:PH domain-containing protein [Acidimicrobiales bacterium]
MRVLRRKSDNVLQLVSFAGLGAAIAVLRQDLPGLAVGAVLVTIGIHTARSGLYLTPDGLVVRNLFRTWRMPWDDVERVDLGSAGHPRLPVVMIRRRSGKPSVPLWCLQPSPRRQRREQAHVAVLKEVQAALREGAPA